MASIASDSGHVCEGANCAICRANIAADTTGRGRAEEPKRVPKPGRQAAARETGKARNEKPADKGRQHRRK